MLHSLIAEPGLGSIVAKSTGSSLITFPDADLGRESEPEGNYAYWRPRPLVREEASIRKG